MNKVVFILHEGRCGSTSLTSVLHDLPHTISLNELLTPGVWLPPSVRDRWEHARDIGDIHVHLIEFLSDCISSIYVPVAIIELKFNQLHNSLAANLSALQAAFKNASFIVLIRKNTLRRTISHIRCVTLGITHTRNSNSNSNEKCERIDLNVNDVHDYSHEPCVSYPLLTLLGIDKSRHEHIEAVAHIFNCLYITYESFENDLDRTACLVREQFCLDTTNVLQIKCPWTRTGNKQLTELLVDSDSVYKLLQGTDYDWMMK